MGRKKKKNKIIRLKVTVLGYGFKENERIYYIIVGVDIVVAFLYRLCK